MAEIGIAFALGVVYSEYWIIRTGCGPPNFNDTLERICYQGVLIYAGLALFHRIVSSTGGTSSNGWRSRSVRETMENEFGPLLSTTLWQMEIAEYSSALAVLGAVVALVFQYNNQQQMDAFSGIDINMCRAIRGDMWYVVIQNKRTLASRLCGGMGLVVVMIMIMPTYSMENNKLQWQQQFRLEMKIYWFFRVSQVSTNKKSK